ncbi:MAG: glycoside hydrolase family 43 protein [Bacteroidaceae bacterium]|nr:glycoside hydrolase family 43 protein [Bacteroidaceae bacterium]
MKTKKIFMTALAAMMIQPLQTFSQTLAKSYKGDAYVNPILPYNLCADPTAVEYNGRLYVYGTNDLQEYNSTKNGDNNTYGKINQLVCMSTADMVNWTFHGTINVKTLSPWIATSWAPSIVSRVEKDGKTHFYLYYTNTASGIGVLTATSPTGPWKDPIGRALIDWSTPGRGNQSNIIDPGVCIDDEGNGWLTFGGGDPNSGGSKLMPGNARIVKLGSNMTSLSGPIKEIPAPFHFEANELNYINGKFVFSYSGGWSCNAGDWSKYTGKGSYACPGNCSILMMTTDDPINGTWKYTGEMLKNPGSFGYPWGNNHSHMQKFGDKYYMIYHTQALAKSMGLNGGYRGIAIDAITVNESTAKVSAGKMTNNGPSLLTAARLIGTDLNEAETMANCAGVGVTKSSNTLTVVDKIHAGDWTMVRGMSFPEGARSFTARLKGTGTLEVRPNKITAAPIATIEFKSSINKNFSVDLSEEIAAGKNFTYLYFVFTSASGTVTFDRYQFSTQTVDELTAVDKVEVDATEVVSTTYYTTGGSMLSERPRKGVYIEKMTMGDGTQKVVKHVK